MFGALTGVYKTHGRRDRRCHGGRGTPQRENLSDCPFARRWQAGSHVETRGNRHARDLVEEVGSGVVVL